MAKTYVAMPMNREVTAFESAVDIIIPYHGQYDKLTNLIESIFRLTKTNFYRLFVVDDASPNADYLNVIAKNGNRRYEGLLRAVRLEQQVGFPAACKIGFDRGESPYVCFVNSDCQVEDSAWLRKMGEALLVHKDAGVRMVSPKTNNPVHPDGKDSPQFADQPGAYDDVILNDDQHLSLFCFMCHRELFARCGGFLKDYPYGYYEDEEFAARMRKNGFKQGVAGKAWIHHEGGCTIKSLWRKNPEIRDQMEKGNRDRCIEDIQKLGQK